MKRNTKSILITLSIILGFSLAVSYGEKSVETFAEELKAFYTVYSNGDIETAEKALLKHLDLILEYKRERIEGINYPDVLMSTYTRLYLVEKKQGDINKANFYLEKSMELHLRGRKVDNTELVKEQNKVIEFYRGIDLHNSVKWLTEATGKK